MSQITIEVLKAAEVTPGPTGKTYKNMVFTFTDLSSKKTEGRKFIDIYSKPVWDTLLAAKPGEFYLVDRVKNDKQFWEWKSMTLTTATAAALAPVTSPAAQTTQSPATKTERVGSWETPTERAAKQIYIVRQSTINAAIEILKAQGKPFGTDAVKTFARDLENYVFDAGVAGLASDDFPE